MPRINQVYLLRFFPPATLGRIALKERAGYIRCYFEECMKQIQPLLRGIEVVSRQEHLLSAGLQGPEEAYLPLKRYLEETRLGELIPDESVQILGAAGQRRF